MFKMFVGSKSQF